MVVFTVATTTAFARLKEDEEEEYEHDEDEEEEKKQHDRLINSAMMFWCWFSDEFEKWRKKPTTHSFPQQQRERGRESAGKKRQSGGAIGGRND